MIGFLLLTFDKEIRPSIKFRNEFVRPYHDWINRIPSFESSGKHHVEDTFHKSLYGVIHVAMLEMQGGRARWSGYRGDDYKSHVLVSVRGLGSTPLIAEISCDRRLTDDLVHELYAPSILMIRRCRLASLSLI